MNITTDNIVNRFVGHFSPIPGAVFCDYYLADQFDEGLIHESYQNPSFIIDRKQPTDPKHAAAYFWRLVRKYAVPTKYEVGVWVQCMLRHCYALGVTTVGDRGDTKLPLDVLNDPIEGMRLLKVLEPVLTGSISELDTAEYKSHIEKVDTGKVKSYVPLIQWLANFFYKSNDPLGRKNIDMNDNRLFAQESLLTLLYKHITGCVGELKRWNDMAGEWTGARFELGPAYSRAWNEILEDAEAHTENIWLRYPSLLVAKPMYVRPQVQVTDDKLLFNELFKTDSRKYNACQEIMYLSNLGSHSDTPPQNSIQSTVAVYCAYWVSDGKAIETLSAHQKLNLADFRPSLTDTVEKPNYDAFRQITAEDARLQLLDIAHQQDVVYGQQLEQARKIQSGGVVVYKSSEEEEIKTFQAQKLKPEISKDELEKKAKETTGLVYIIGAAAIAFFAFR